MYNKSGDSMNKKDLRYIKTEEIIRKAFKECVVEKGFEQTFVSTICEKAKISRNTFYVHYVDKYDLLDTLFEELQEYFNQSFTEEIGNDLFNFKFDSSIHWYMNAVNKKWEYHKLLLDCSYEKFLDTAIETIVFRPIRKYFPQFDKRIQDDIKLHLNVKYMFYGMIAFTKIWLDHYDEISLEEATEEMKKLCITPVTLFIEKIKNK